MKIITLKITFVFFLFSIAFIRPLQIDADYIILQHENLDLLEIQMMKHNQKPWVSANIDHSPIIITSNNNLDSFIFANGWDGNGSSANPYIIDGLNINSLGPSCIDIRNVTKHLVIKNCKITGASDPLTAGIILTSVANCKITNCTINGNNAGIILNDCVNCTLKDNRVQNSALSGITLRFSSNCILNNNTSKTNSLEGIKLETCTKVNITDNVALSNGGSGLEIINNSSMNSLMGLNSSFNAGNGVKLVSGSTLNTLDKLFISENSASGIEMHSSSRNTLVNSSITDNLGFGISMIFQSNINRIENNLLDRNTAGCIIVIQSNNNTISRNTMHGGEGIGIELSDLSNKNSISLNYIEFYQIGLKINNMSNGNLIINNTFAHNYEYGICIETSSLNTIFHNWLHKQLTTPARDDGQNNEWDDGVNMGNYWAFLSLTNANSILGTAGSVDHYPVLMDVFPPTIDHPTDIFLEEGEETTLQWDVFELNPRSYSLFLNGSVLDSRLLTNSSLKYTISGLLKGVYNYTLVVNDIMGQVAIDTVLIICLADSIAPIITGPSEINGSLWSGKKIVWQAWDLNPQNYTIFLDQTPFRTEYWTSGDYVSLDISSLNLGVNNVTIVFLDFRGNMAHHTTIVTVYINFAGILGYGLIGTSIAILVIFTVILHVKKSTYETTSPSLKVKVTI